MNRHNAVGNKVKSEKLKVKNRTSAEIRTASKL